MMQLGSMKCIVGSSLMTNDQLKNGVESLIGILEKLYEAEIAPEVVIDDDDDDVIDGILPPTITNKPHKLAGEEIATLFREYRKTEQLPVFERNKNTKYLHGTEPDSISEQMVIIGDIITERGIDLPSQKNYADYFKGGQFEHVRFWLDHKKEFPKLWLYAVRIASANPTEVSCESLFSESGYASCPRRTRLKTENFERETIMSHNMQKVYFDLENAVDTYMKRDENKDWGISNNRDDLNYMERRES